MLDTEQAIAVLIKKESALQKEEGKKRQLSQQTVAIYYEMMHHSIQKGQEDPQERIPPAWKQAAVTATAQEARALPDPLISETPKQEYSPEQLRGTRSALDGDKRFLLLCSAVIDISFGITDMLSSQIFPPLCLLR